MRFLTSIYVHRQEKTCETKIARANMPLTGDNSSQAIHIKKLLYHSLKTLDTARNAKKNLKKKTK